MDRGSICRRHDLGESLGLACRLWGRDNLQKSNTYTEADKQALISAYYNRE